MTTRARMPKMRNMLRYKGFIEGKVGGGGDLKIAEIAWGDVELVTELGGKDARALGIGDATLLGLGHHGTKGAEGEGLRGLCAPHAFATCRGGDAAISHGGVEEGFVGLDTGDGIAKLTGDGKIGGEDFGGYEGTNSIMDHDEGGIGEGMKGCHTIAKGLEASGSCGGCEVGMGIVPPLIATDDEDVIGNALKGTEGVMEDGLATDFEELFGKMGAATVAAASCKDEGDNGG